MDVGKPVWYSVRDSVQGLVWGSVWGSVRISAWDSITVLSQNSVSASVFDSVIIPLQRLNKID